VARRPAVAGWPPAMPRDFRALSRPSPDYLPTLATPLSSPSVASLSLVRRQAQWGQRSTPESGALWRAGRIWRKAIENTLCAIDYLSKCLMALLHAFLPPPNNTLFGTDWNCPYRSTCFSVAGSSAQRETHYQRVDYKMCMSLCVSLYKGPMGDIDSLVSWFA
jgi:hypothetical protein